MKKYYTIIIGSSVLVLIYLYFKNKKPIGSSPVWYEDCGNFQCGGMPSPNNVSPTCPSHCQCGEGNPMIPDAPRECIPKA